MMKEAKSVSRYESVVLAVIIKTVLSFRPTDSGRVSHNFTRVRPLQRQENLPVYSRHSMGWDQ